MKIELVEYLERLAPQDVKTVYAQLTYCYHELDARRRQYEAALMQLTATEEVLKQRILAATQGTDIEVENIELLGYQPTPQLTPKEPS